ncbi:MULTISPECIES: hypothetical protein [Methylobacterium]|uniref:hypothetical protein n=1 Tax=Methylobacterium TaxID=407 RepID=UPI0013EBE5E1|nr:hypothetical protein [Methylobacterium sp. DB0501]NGM34489.1 hypothetical protein [Methylobacterium sp. DB0501]
MTPEVRLLGIDPGLTGALALLGLTAGGPSLAIADMPEVHKTVDAAALADLIRRWPRPNFIVLEEVGPQPRDGVRQAFSFGQSYATARTVALMLEIPLHLVRPQAWKGHFRLRGGPEGKEAGRALALRRFPANANLFARKKDHNRAEAALLALYGAERLLPAGSLPDPDRVGGVATAGGVAAPGQPTPSPRAAGSLS